MSDKSGKLRIILPLALVAPYLLVCLMPIVAVGDFGSFSVFELPAVNIVQVMAYPAFLLIIVLLEQFVPFIREGGTLLTAVVSFVNLLFLVLTPITLKKQIIQGWPGYWVSGDAVTMRLGYFLLYFLTIAYLAVFLIMVRIRALKSKNTRAGW